MSQDSALIPPGDELAYQEDILAKDYARDHLRYDGSDSDDFAGEDGYSGEEDYFRDVDVSGISERGGSESDDRAALYSVPDYTDKPEPPDPTQVAGQTTCLLYTSPSPRD